MLLRTLIFIFGLTLFLSCGRNHLYDKQVAQLDSIKIVLKVKLNELNKIEANIQHKGFSKYKVYKQFLSSSLKDTISRAEASAIQQFLNAGAIIEQYNSSKQELIRQAELSVSQLQKLSGDFKNGAVQSNQATAFFENERSHAEKLVQVMDKNITAANIALMNFKNSITRTEDLIRNINNGQLPDVVAETTE